jgi:hypothetical protein
VNKADVLYWFTPRKEVSDYRRCLGYDKTKLSRFRSVMAENGVRLIERGLVYVSAAYTPEGLNTSMKNEEHNEHLSGANNMSVNGVNGAIANSYLNGNSPAGTPIVTPIERPPLRVLLGGIYHETHTFIPGLTTRRDIDWIEGDNCLEARGSSSPQAGAISVADECGWQLIPILDARSGAGPTLADEVVQAWWQRWSVELQTRSGCFDAIFLALHGAMVSQSLLDVEGEMLRRMRHLVGRKFSLQE